MTALAYSSNLFMSGPPIMYWTLAALKPPPDMNDTGVTLTVTNAQATGTVSNVRYRFEWSELDTFPADSRTGSRQDIAQGSGSTRGSVVLKADTSSKAEHFKLGLDFLTTRFSVTGTALNAGFVWGEANSTATVAL